MTNAKRQILTTPKPAAKLRAKRLSLVVVGIVLIVVVAFIMKPQANKETVVVTPSATSTAATEIVSTSTNVTLPTEVVATETVVSVQPETLPGFEPKNFKMQYEGTQYRKIGEKCYQIPSGWTLFSSYKNNPSCPADGAIDLGTVTALPNDFGVAPAGPLPHENYYFSVNGETIAAVQSGWSRICNVSETVKVNSVIITKFHVFIDTSESHAFTGRRSGGCYVVREQYKLQTLRFAVRQAYEDSFKYTFFIADIDPILSGHWFGKQPLQVLP